MEQSTPLTSSQLIFCALFFIGTFKIIALLWSVFGSFLRRRLDLKKRYNGGWALVTGGSEGIGQAIARELANSGFDLILVSRSLQKLKKSKEIIQSLNPIVKIEIHSIDLSEIKNEDDYKHKFSTIFQKDVSILVNNVGYYAPDFFLQLPYKAIRTEAKVNLIPIVVLTNLFLQKNKNRSARTGLINLSSAAGMIVYKGTAHYSATKTYDDYFSRSLSYEISSKTDVLTVRPFYVSTPMTKNISYFTFCSPQQTAIEAINTLGNAQICYGPLLHRLNGAMLGLAGPTLATWTSSRSIGDFKNEYKKHD